LRPKADGGWTEKVLHSFNDNGTDGAGPDAGLIFDGSGNLYSTTFYGGSGTACAVGCGTVFELTPKASGGWTEKVLHSFSGKDGISPVSGLILDGSGNLYGTTPLGDSETNCAGNCGTVFELMPKAGGGWTEKVLHSFDYNHPRGGLYPYGALILDKAGNLYGTTEKGGAHDLGTVYEITP